MKTMQELIQEGAEYIAYVNRTEPLEHIQVTVTDGEIQPMGTMWSPAMTPIIGQSNSPINVLAHSPQDAIWELYQGPLAGSPEFQEAEQQALRRAG